MLFGKTSNDASLPISTFIVLTYICSGLATMYAQDDPKEDYIWHDPTKIVTAEPCRECHQSEYAVWKETKHATGFKTLHRKKLAERISKALDFKLIKRESLCLKCHYLAGTKRNQLRAISGVSCESCHGAARDWIDIHNNYGKGSDYNTEPDEHKTQRVAESKAKGMFRPSELYEVVSNCFQCHTVPHERLVNEGGHTSGSSDFEFVQRAKAIQHNFLQAQFDPTRTENAERSPERKRVMYLVGRAVDLEYSIRGSAMATEKGGYIRAMQRRVRSAINKLKAITNRVSLPEVKDMLTVVGTVQIKVNNESALLNSATEIGNATKEFIKNHDGTQLASLDGLISGTEEPIAEITPNEPPATEPKANVTEATDPAKPADVIESNDRQKKTQPVYAKKQFIRSRSAHKTIGPSCDCHGDEMRWWETDPHFSSAQPFIDKEQKNRQIATLYGLSASEMTKGNSLCMDCHGTIITGEATEDVFDGVSCESCHGPAGDYKRPHSADNPPNGYSAGKDFGMLVLENLDEWAEACAQCHYITDPRLLSSGHTSGGNFDVVQASKKINHWIQPVDIPAGLKTAYEQAKQKSGPIPQIVLTSPTEPTPTQPSNSPPADISTQQTNSAPPKLPTIRPVDFRVRFPSKRKINLPPFPTINDSTSVEEILLILKNRIELLYQKLGKK